MPSFYQGIGYGEVIFLLNVIGTVAIGCYPYGWKAFGLMVLAFLVGCLPGFFLLFVVVPVFDMSHAKQYTVAMVQGVFFLPRILMPRVARSFYHMVPGLHPCRIYALGAIVAMLGSCGMRVLQ